MRIAAWKTGHGIADTVADALYAGLCRSEHTALPAFNTRRLEDVALTDWDAHIGYGILRGMDKVFARCDAAGRPWFNIDRGYFAPGHYDGYYRVSCRGTQALWHEGAPSAPYAGTLEPFRDDGKKVLICPPSSMAVVDFFPINYDWGSWAWRECEKAGFPIGCRVIRYKGPHEPPVDWNDIGAVVTFNSSVGWEAVRRGIPCLSSPEHSAVGSFYREKSLDRLLGIFHTLDRELLFSFMQAHQFTLNEIRAGKAWQLIRHYLSSSAMTAENPSPAMSPRIPSASARSQISPSDT